MKRYSHMISGDEPGRTVFNDFKVANMRRSRWIPYSRGMLQPCRNQCDVKQVLNITRSGRVMLYEILYCVASFVLQWTIGHSKTGRFANGHPDTSMM